MSAHSELSRSILLEGGRHGDWWHHSQVAPLLRLVAYMDGSCGKGLVILLVTMLLSHLVRLSEGKMKIC